MNLDQAVRATDDIMMDIVRSEVSVLQEASQHIIGAGGKRVRPRLLYLAYSAVGGKNLEEAIPLAAAIELVHTATLVHDDINDHGTVRRGRTTVNERWGRTFALLTGDFLFTKVYELMAPYKDMNVTFAEATVALVEGETLQAWAAKENNLNREIYQQIVAKKTASLFRAAAMLGAKLGNGAKAEVDALGEFGFYLGLAFQIIDDLLDLVGDPRLMGKQNHVDAAQGKGVATAVGFGDNGNGTAAVVAQVAAPLEASLDDPFFAIKQRLVENGAIEEGRKMAQILSIRANSVLDNLAPSNSIEQLRALLAMVLERDH
jgi:geranylgeranyl pyrophosphate synthase